MISTSYSSSVSQQVYNKPTVSAPKIDEQPKADPMKPVRLNVTDDASSLDDFSREQLSEVLLNKNGFYNEEQKLNAEYRLWKESADVYWQNRDSGKSRSDSLAAAIGNMDEAGPLERQTFFWNDNRAQLVKGYEFQSNKEGKEAKDFSIEDPLYKSLKDFYDKLAEDTTEALEKDGRVKDRVQNVDYIAIKNQYEIDQNTGYSFKV